MAATEPLGSAADTRAVGEQREVEGWRSAQRGEPPKVKEATPAGSWVVRSLIDAAVAGLITAALGLFFIGLTTDGPSGPLAIRERWGMLATFVAIVFGVRLALNLLFYKNPSPLRIGRLPAATQSPAFGAVSKAIGAILLIVALVLPFLLLWLAPTQARLYIDLGILILTYVMLGWGLNIVVGLAGLLDLGYVAFYAIGAYSFALLQQYFDLGFWICLPLAGILAAFWGIILGFPVLRLRGDYLAIVTLAFGEIIRIVLLNWYDFTGGPNGILGIPDPTLFGLSFSRTGEPSFAEFFGLEYSSVYRVIYLYYIILLLALLTNLVTIRLRRLPVGRAWEAMREDEIACRSLGINTTNTKLTAFAIGAMFGGVAGSFFATRQGFISPESFTFLESAIVLSIVVLGGLGSQIGVVFAAIVMIGGIEALRNLGFLSQVFGPNFDPVHYRMLIFGLVMVVIMVWRPRGLVATRSPSVVLKEKKRIGAGLVAQGEGH